MCMFNMIDKIYGQFLNSPEIIVVFIVNGKFLASPLNVCYLL